MTIQPDHIFRIATLIQNDPEHSHEGANVTVEYRDLQWCIESDVKDCSVAAISNIPETYLISKSRGDTNPRRIPASLVKDCSKSFKNSHAAAYDAATFLSGASPALSKKEKKTLTTSSSASVSIDDAVLLLSRDDTPESTFKPSEYQAFKFLLLHTSNEDDKTAVERSVHRQFLMIRQPGLQRNGAMSLSNDLKSLRSFDTVEICSGMCLFSEQDLDSCTQNGSIQPRQLRKLPISICEKEMMTRLSTTIANTAAVYLCGNESSQSPALRINIDIPSVQYYQHALEAFDRGTCAPSDVMCWMFAIENRRRRLFRAFAGAIEFGLKQRALKESQVKIRLSRGLAAATANIHRKLNSAPKTSNWIQEILISAQEDPNEFWKDFFQLLDEDEKNPSTWRQFHTLSYVYEASRPVLRVRAAAMQAARRTERDAARGGESRGTSKIRPMMPPRHATDESFFNSKKPVGFGPAPRVLLIAIDDSDEGRIYTKANEKLTKLSVSAARSPGASLISSPPVVSRILTIYPAPQVIVGTSNMSVDWKRKSLWRASLRGCQRLGDALYFRTKAGLMETDSEVLKSVYDRDLVTQLEECLLLTQLEKWLLDA